MSRRSLRVLFRASAFAALALALAAVAAVPGLRASRAPRDVPVLMYHNVLPADACENVYQVSADEFAAQLDALLAAGFRTVLPGDLARAARGRGFLPRRPVVITFDDGYEGVARWAEPELARRGMKAVCYVIVDRLATNGAPREAFDSGPLLTAEEARAMARRGTVALGVHSRTHGRNFLRLAEEARSGRRALRRRTGVKTKDYCYPFGQWGTPGMLDAVREAGYATATICEDRMFRYAPDADFLRIPRLSVYGGRHAVGLASADPAAGRASLTNGGFRLPLRAVLRAADGSVAATGGVVRVGSAPAVFDFGAPIPEGASVEAWDASLLFRYL